MVSVIAQVLYVALWLFFIAMLARLVADWIQVFARDWQPKGALWSSWRPFTP